MCRNPIITVNSMMDYLTKIRNIQVSADEAKALNSYWAMLQALRPPGGTVHAHDAPVAMDFTPIKAYPHDGTR